MLISNLSSKYSQKWQKKLLSVPYLTPKIILEMEEYLYQEKDPIDVILTFTPTKEVRPLLNTIKIWSDQIGYGEGQKIWEKAYQHIDTLLPLLPKYTENFFRIYYHHCASMMFHAILVHTLLTSPTKDKKQILIVQASLRSFLPFLDCTFMDSLHSKKRIPLFQKKIYKFVERILYSTKTQNFSSSAFSPPTHFHSPSVSDQNRILVALDDSGTRVNLNPGKILLSQIKKKQLPYLFVSSRKEVVSEILQEGHPAKLLGIPKLSTRKSFYTHFLQGVFELFIESPIWNSPIHQVFRSLFLERYIELKGFQECSYEELENWHFQKPFSSFLLINETTLLTSLLSKWAAEKNIPSFGFTPILMGNRPDCSYFPTKYHFVYGKQLEEKMIQEGISSHQIMVVGSPTYEKTKKIDRKKTKHSLLSHFFNEKAETKKLVTVGTEALEEPLREITPILATLQKIPKVRTILKVHPSDSFEYYKNLANQISSSSKIVVIQDTHLEELLAASDLLICIVSNIIVTAACLGTPTLVCDFSNKRKVLDFVKEGLAYGCFQESKLKEKIQALLFFKNRKKDFNQKCHRALPRFNGQNDGKSGERIINLMIQKIEKELF